MPLLDLSDITHDIDLADLFNVIRQVETVTNKGRTSVTPATTNNVVGVVTIATPEDMKRVPDYEFAQKAISIVTQFRLRTASPGYQPDLIYWHGDYYLVKWVDDYAGFGGGTIQAIAILTAYQPQPPPALA